jgi:glycosyltransferase involved in cell wall biosynthesis
VKVAFLVNDLQLSGGVGVVVAHARQLVEHHGFDVTLVLVREQESAHWDYETLPGLHVAGLADAREDRFDVVVGTWWETAFSLLTVPADRHAMFVQSLEDRFYRPGEPERVAAPLVLDLPVAYITEARWIADALADLRPDAPCFFVRNGIDKSIFAPPEAPPVRVAEPLRILIEGRPSVWFKQVPEAIQAAAAMTEQRHVTVVSGERAELEGFPVDRVLGPLTHRQMADAYAESDVVLKLTRVEGMFGPPLEGFHRGATCVVTPVTGYDEYIEHGWNGLVADWDDLPGTARLLDLLAADRRLLHFLRHNALRTARGWPSWEQSSQVMAVALRRIHQAPRPEALPAASRMLADVRAGVEDQRQILQERNELAVTARRVERVKQLPGIRHAWRTLWSPTGQRLIWPVLQHLRRLLTRR